MFVMQKKRAKSLKKGEKTQKNTKKYILKVNVKT